MVMLPEIIVCTKQNNASIKCTITDLKSLFYIKWKSVWF